MEVDKPAKALNANRRPSAGWGVGMNLLACAAAVFCAAGALQVPSCWLDAPPFVFQSITKTIPRHHAPAVWAGHLGGGRAETIARTADAAGLPNFCKCIGRAASGLSAQPGSISNDELVGPVTDSSTRGWNASAGLSAAADLSVAGGDLSPGRAERALERIYLIADAACSIYPSVCQCLQFSSSEYQQHKRALDSSGALFGATLATATSHADELAGFHSRSFAAQFQQLTVQKLEDSRLTPRFKLAERTEPASIWL